MINEKELKSIKKDIENDCLSFMKIKALTYRIFINGNDDISFFVSLNNFECESIMTVSKEMFYQVFDVTMCNKVFKRLQEIVLA